MKNGARDDSLLLLEEGVKRKSRGSDGIDCVVCKVPYYANHTLVVWESLAASNCRYTDLTDIMLPLGVVNDSVCKTSGTSLGFVVL